MKPPRIAAVPLLAACLALTVGAVPVRAQESAAPAAAATPAAEVPKGEVLRFTFENSRVFPGTFREYWVYIPAQYKPDKPACVYVNQDGVQWRAPEVFDRLIASGEMPVTIGVFVMHGRVRAADGKTALDRFNRSLEYDGLGDAYARFLLDELLPEVETKKASDGRAIRLSKDGNDRAIGGSSSGAVCAFTAAWERPDAFRRVFSAIGTYVGLRGADRYPTLIRKTEPKPLRVFLQDGSRDLNIYGGDWWMANQSMERALTFAGYAVNHVWGEGGHDGKQGTEVFPDAMRWLWAGWPKPVEAAGQSGNGMLRDIAAPGETWSVDPVTNEQPVGHPRTLSVDAKGFVMKYISLRAALALNNTVFAADNRFFSTAPGGKVNSYDSFDTAKGTLKPTAILSGAKTAPPPAALVVSATGNVYVAGGTKGNATTAAPLTLLRPDGKKWTRVALDANGLRAASALTLSPDRTLLYAAEAGSHWVWSYQIQPDGTLKHGQRYYWLHSPDDADDAGATALAVDTAGRLYAATRMGVQVADQAGRVNVILPLPGNRAATDLTFGDADFGTLYVAAGDTVYRRKMKATGSPAFAAPTRPNPPGL